MSTLLIFILKVDNLFLHKSYKFPEFSSINIYIPLMSIGELGDFKTAVTSNVIFGLTLYNCTKLLSLAYPINALLA